LTTVSAATGVDVTITVAVDGDDVTVPPEGVVPDTVAELVIDPLVASVVVAV
jgi:hypothetical protein